MDYSQQLVGNVLAARLSGATHSYEKLKKRVLKPQNQNESQLEKYGYFLGPQGDSPKKVPALDTAQGIGNPK